jgi:uncharacterized protein (TIGR02599 family)
MIEWEPFRRRSIRFRTGVCHLAGAFTLVEMLVSLAIFTLLAVIIFGILSQVSGVWRQAQSQIEPRKSGRAVLDFMSKELGMVELPRDRSMLYASASAAPQASDLGLQFVVNPSQVGAAFRNPQALFWQAPVATGSGDKMAEVGYFVRWDLSKPENPRAMLCRFFVDPADPNYLISTNPTAWITDSLLNTVSPGVEDTGTPANSYKGWVADNVIALWVRCLDPLGNPIVTDALETSYADYAYDSRRGYRYETSGMDITKSGFKDPSGNFNILATLPDSIEIALVIIDARAANRLTAKPTYTVTTPPTASSFWTDIQNFIDSLPDGVREGARVYSTRMSLTNPAGN